jgi:predicted regulator of Ras-like GTPase activity (Roadblock/LC7/MglB family)
VSWLSDLEALPSVRRAVLAGMDGLVIESVGRGGLSASVLAAEMAALARAMEGITGALGEDLRRFTLATGSYELLAVCFDGYCLGALIERGGERAVVGQTLTNLAMRLVDQL